MTAPTPLTNDKIVTFAPAAGSFEPIDGVSARYSFVPTLTAVDLLRDAGWFPIHAEQSAVRVARREGYQRHLIRFAKNGLSFDGERVDLVLYNSHDCGCAFKLLASVWRQICENGLMVASEFANFSHKHIGFKPDDFVHSAREIASAAGIIAERVDEMKVIEMTRTNEACLPRLPTGWFMTNPNRPRSSRINCSMNAAMTTRATIFGAFLT